MPGYRQLSLCQVTCAEVSLQSILFPKGFLTGAVTAPPHHILLVQLVPLSPKRRLTFVTEILAACLQLRLVPLCAPCLAFVPSTRAAPGPALYVMTALQLRGKVTLFWEFSSQLTRVIPPKLLYLELAQISSTCSLPGLVPPVTQTL